MRGHNVLRTLERLTGIGPVTHENGGLVREMRYHITTFREFIDGDIPGLRSIQGKVELEGMEAFELIGESLTLRLEDGRILDFFISNSDGRIANRSQRFGETTA
jgi:hypothetical protein